MTAEVPQVVDYLRARLAYEVDVVEAARMQAEGEGVIVDTRRTASWDHGHVRGAVHLPATALDRPEDLHRALDGIAPETPLIVYGWGPGCNGATRTALALVEAGYRVREMIGGFEYWARNGLPLDSAAGDVTQRPDPLVTAATRD